VTAADALLDDVGFAGIARAGDTVYAARKPDMVAVLRVDAAGTITQRAELRIPGAVALWGLTADGDRLYAADLGPHPAGEDHAGGALYVLDVSDPGAPAVLGQTLTTGASKDVAVLPHGVLAVASGSAGIDIVDVTDATAPALLHTLDTPGSVNALAADGGYLLVADWGVVRLYDVSERGVLRQVEATDVGTAAANSFDSAGSGIFAAMNIWIAGTRFLVSEFDSIYAGTLRPGHTAPRLVVQDRTILFNVEDVTDPMPLVVRLENGGRSTLRVQAQANRYVAPLRGPVLVPPGARGALEIEARGLAASTGDIPVVLQSNDPETPRRAILLRRVAGGYRAGDALPEFRLPSVNHCTPGGGCSMEEQCFDSQDPALRGRPMVLAFFSSW
jgi:hypothetical protein